MRRRGYLPLDVLPDGTEIWNEPGKLPKHDTDLIDRWNAAVPPKGLVRMLGDMFWRRETIEPILRKLHGDIHLVLGNHDRRKMLEQYPRLTLKHPHMIKYGDQKIWLSHYAHRTWPCQPHGAWHLYGHSHGNLPDWYWLPACDVGIDADPQRRPYSMEHELAPMLEARAKAVNDPARRMERLRQFLHENDDIRRHIPIMLLQELQEIPRLLGGDHHLNNEHPEEETDKTQE